MWQAISKGRWRGVCVAAVLTCSTYARADATTGTFTLSTTLSDPCAVFAVQTSPTTTRIVYGEPIAFAIDGSSTAVLDFSDTQDQDGDGGVNLKFHVEAHGRGVGQNSGIPYVFHANALLKANTSGDPLSPSFRFDGTFKMDARILGQGNLASDGKVAQGAQDNALLRFDVRVRMANGTVTALASNFTIECQGSPWTNLMTANIAGTKTPVGRGFGDPWNKYAWSMKDFAGGMVVGTKNAFYDLGAFDDPSPALQACTNDASLPAPDLYRELACLELLEPRAGADAGPAEIWRYDHTKKTWSAASLPAYELPPDASPGPRPAYAQGFRVMATHANKLYAGADLGAFITGVSFDYGGYDNWSFPGSQLLVSNDGRTFTAIASCATAGPCTTRDHVTYDEITAYPPVVDVNSSIRGLASFDGKLFVGTFNLKGGQLWSYDPATDEWVKIASLPAVAVTDLRVLGSTLFVGVSGTFDGSYLYRYDTTNGLALVDAPANPPYLATSLGALTLFTSSRGVLYVGTVDLENGFTLQTTTDGVDFDVVTADGFGNPGNGYAWSLADVNGRVFVGTFNQDFGAALPRGSAELWSSDDDVNWRQVALPVGWGPWNYGVRTMDVGNKSLFLGSASNMVAPDLTFLGDGTALSPGAEVWTLRTTVAAPTGGGKKK